MKFVIGHHRARAGVLKTLWPGNWRYWGERREWEEAWVPGLAKMTLSPSGRFLTNNSNAFPAQTLAFDLVKIHNLLLCECWLQTERSLLKRARLPSAGCLSCLHV